MSALDLHHAWGDDPLTRNGARAATASGRLRSTSDRCTVPPVDADIDALANIVNTVGVMGMGIAHQFENACSASPRKEARRT